jgi:hypothetical protein
MPTVVDGINMAGIMPGAGQKQIGVNELGLPVFEKRNKTAFNNMHAQGGIQP